MKMIVGWLVSWALYGLGCMMDALLRISHMTDLFYPPYRILMLGSFRAQAWGGAGAWRDK